MKLIKWLTAALLLISVSAHAESELKISKTGAWKFTVMPKRSPIFNDAEATLTLPQENPHDYRPTVYIEKLPVVAVPESIAEWNNLIFLNLRKNKPMLSRPEMLHRVGSQYRYVVEAQIPQKAETPMNTAVMAVSLNGEVYVFSFSHHQRTYNQHMPAIRELFRTMEIGLVQSTRP